MKTPIDLALVLLDAFERVDMSHAALAEASGVSPRTLTYVLSGKEDYKLSTLTAIADRLGLELDLHPKRKREPRKAPRMEPSAPAAGTPEKRTPPVRSVVVEVVEALHARCTRESIRLGSRAGRRRAESPFFLEEPSEPTD